MLVFRLGPYPKGQEKGTISLMSNGKSNEEVPLSLLVLEALVMFLTGLIPDSVPPLLKDGPFLLAVMALVPTASWLGWRLRHRVNPWVIFVVWLAVSAWAMSLIWYGTKAVWADLRPSAPEIVERPKLRVRVVPDVAKKQGLSFHFSVENLGPGNVEITSSQIDVPGGYGIDDHPTSERRPIAADDEIAIPTDLPAIFKGGRIYLVLKYKILRAGDYRQATYAFDIPQRLVGPLSYATATDVASTAAEPSFCDRFKGQLSSPEAYMAFGFPEKYQGKPHGDITCPVGTRKLTISTEQRYVEFSTVYAGYRQIFRANFGITENQHHRVMLAWKEEPPTDLWVDGQVDGQNDFRRVTDGPTD